MPTDTDEDTVVRLLTQTTLGVSPAAIAANARILTDTDLDEPTVDAVLDDLAAENKVEPLDDTDYYRLTDHGRDYATTEFGENAIGYID